MNRYAVSAMLAGAFFGCTGLFTRYQTAMGLVPMDMLLIRCIVAVICFSIQILVTDRSLFRVRLKDLWLFAAVALAGQLFFSYCYYTAITMMSISTACILLYLSPAIVMILSHFIFKEKAGKRGLLAVALCVLGCACVSGFGGTVSGKGLVFGLASAFAFALINILNRFIQRRGYKGTTVNLYLFTIAGIGACFFTNPIRTLSIATASLPNFAICAATGLVTSFLSYLFFSIALGGCDSGKVAIFASTEPVVASLISVFLFNEHFGVLSFIGIVLVLGSIVLMNTKGKEEGAAPSGS